jgi:uncharacterized protein YlxP (DUF503 family)
MMQVGYCVLVVDTRDAASLKEKRNVLRSMKQKLREGFNVSVAEIGRQDLLYEGLLGVVSVSGDYLYLEGLLQKLQDALERWFPGRIADSDVQIRQILPGE